MNEENTRFGQLTFDFKQIAYHSKTWEEIEQQLKDKIKNEAKDDVLINALIDLIGCFKQAENSYKEDIKKLQKDNKRIIEKFHELNSDYDKYGYELAREQVRNEALRQFIINLKKK